MQRMSAAKHLFDHVAGSELPDGEVFASGTKVILRAKNQAVFGAGENQPYVFVVRSGIIKLSYLRADGLERIKSFVGAGEFFACANVLFAGETTDFHATALEQSCIERLEFSGLRDLMTQHSAWRKVIRKLMGMDIFRKDMRERELLIMTTEERYQSFLQRYAAFAERIQKSDIALYLGITPEAFSRIRRRAGDIGPPIPG